MKNQLFENKCIKLRSTLENYISESSTIKDPMQRLEGLNMEKEDVFILGVFEKNKISMSLALSKKTK